MSLEDILELTPEQIRRWVESEQAPVAPPREVEGVTREAFDALERRVVELEGLLQNFARNVRDVFPEREYDE